MKTLLYTCIAAVTLTGCNSQISTNLNDAMQNPLFAERYAEDINERLTSLQIKQVPELEDKDLLGKVEAQKAKWRAVSDEASQKRFDGRYGGFSLANENEYIKGGVLLYEDILYFSSDFDVSPSPNLAIYFSNVPDPRSVEFPTAQDSKFTTLILPYGMQQYSVEAIPEDMRTIVIYDEFLGRIVGFAQL